jgi:Skp family chaperone for outer membrane proteins
MRRAGFLCRAGAFIGVAFGAALCLAGGAQAQAQSPAPAQAQAQTARAEVQAVIRSPVLTLNYEQFIAGSQMGQQMSANYEAERARLEAANAEIASQLEAEELALTKARDTMQPDAFRKAASDFDEKVQKIRQERRDAETILARKRDDLRSRFEQAAVPVLSALMREAGAAVILEVRSTVLSLEQVDITDLAIQRLDAAFAASADAPAEQ